MTRSTSINPLSTKTEFLQSALSVGCTGRELKLLDEAWEACQQNPAMLQMLLALGGVMAAHNHMPLAFEATSLAIGCIHAYCNSADQPAKE